MKFSLLNIFIRWLGKLLAQGAKKLVPRAIKLAKSKTGKSIRRTVKNAAIRGATNLAEDVLRGENVKSSIKKNAKKASSEAVTGVASIGAKALKRKLSEDSNNQKKSKSVFFKIKKKHKQRGSGSGTLFD